MKRWVFNAAAAASWGLCVLALLLFVQSCLRFNELRYPGIYGPAPSRELWVVTSHGGVGAVVAYYDNYLPSHVPAATQPRELRFHSSPVGSERERVYQSFLSDRPVKWRAGFALYHEEYVRTDRPHPGPNRATRYFVAAPLWVVVAATAIMPALWFRRALIRHRRALRGLCKVCGYDLRATPDRCPECGADVARASSP